MNIEVLELTGGVVLRPDDDLDLLGYLALSEKIDDLLRDGAKHVIIDLELVTYVNSSAARALLALREKANGTGGGITLAEVRGGARVALEGVGALGVLTAYETVQEAVSSVDAV